MTKVERNRRRLKEDVRLCGLGGGVGTQAALGGVQISAQHVRHSGPHRSARGGLAWLDARCRLWTRDMHADDAT